MAGFVRWFAVPLAVFAVLNAEDVEGTAASPVELATDQKDAIENSENLAYQEDSRGRRNFYTY